MSELIATVFGGTGLVGHAVVQVLVAEGYTVRVPTRTLDKASDLKVLGKNGQVIPFRASVRTDMSVAAALSGSDLVINLIGSVTEDKQNSFKAIHVEVAARIARIARSENVRHLVHFSTMGAAVSSPLGFFKTKAMGEDAVRAFFPNAIIFKPSVIYGVRDRFLNKMALCMRHIFWAPMVAGGKTRFQPIYVGDVAQAVVNACTLFHTKGHRYALAGPDIYSVKTLWQLLERIMHKKRWKLSVPMGLAYAKALLVELWFWPPFKTDHLDLLKKDWVYQPEEGQSIKSLGIQPVALEKKWLTYIIRQESIS